MSKADYIKNYCYNNILEGGRAVIDGRLFDEAFLCGWPTIYKTPEQAFLSSMIGSGCGMWRISRDLETRNVIISRHKVSNKRYYIDPDREYLFTKQPDGTLERNDVEY